MNQIITITHHDFTSFKNESLSVDFISLNIQRINSNQIIRLAVYFQDLGFNSYQKQLDFSQFRQDINNNNSSSNPFEVYFILNIPYQKEIIQLQFPGVSGKQFYKLIKQNDIQWNQFLNPVLSRLDLVYQRTSKSNDPISTIDFINSSYIQFQQLHLYKNLLSERNQKGLILKIGNRKSSRHYRIYTNQKNNLLRFEAEMKGDLIKDFQDLFLTSSFQQYQFESKLAYQFFKYSFELFSSLHQSSHIDWLISRIRPFQSINTLHIQHSIINLHYLNQMDFKLINQKQHLITLLKLLVFVRRLNYTPGELTAKYRRYNFPLKEFIQFLNKKNNHYQLNKTIEFFDLVKQNFVIESFSDKHYRMLVTVPDVNVTKPKKHWNVEIWIAEELFDYFHPFIFSDLFQTNLSTYQFQVLFEIIKTYSSIDLRKEFHIDQFLDSYPSQLSNQQKRQIKEYFIHYIKIFYQEGKLQDKLLDLSSNTILQIKDLNLSHSKIAVFETIHVKFL
jgi:hypothetical protein